MWMVYAFAVRYYMTMYILQFFAHEIQLGELINSDNDYASFMDKILYNYCVQIFSRFGRNWSNKKCQQNVKEEKVYR